MKILQITPVFYPACKRGGIVTAVYNLSKELSRRGHDITVYTTDNFDKNNRIKAHYLEIKHIKIYYFLNLSNELAWDNIFLPLGMFIRIILNSNNFDLIHLQDYRFIPHIAAYISSKLYGIPYVYQPRYSYATFFQKGFLKRIFDITFGHRILQNAKMLIAQLPSEAREYECLGIQNEKIAIIPNGFDMHELLEVPDKGMFRAKYGIGNECKIVLYLGRIDRIKGVDILIESFAEITKKIENALLIIIGPDAGHLKNVKELIGTLALEHHVLLLGPILGKDKMAAYVDSNVYVMPSMYEGLSIAPLEAYACNTPIILTDRCGSAQWMADEFDYIIPYNKEKMIEAIIQALNKTELQRDNVDEKVRRFNLLQERFSWISIGEQTERLYYKVTNLKAEKYKQSEKCNITN
jgi:glycosyltransferase involved in cell wall biosynthesis